MAKFAFAIPANDTHIWNASTDSDYNIIAQDVPEGVEGDNYVQVPIDSLVESIEEEICNGGIPASVYKKIIKALMQEEEFSDYIVTEALKHAVSHTSGKDAMIFKVAKMTWGELCNDYRW